MDLVDSYVKAVAKSSARGAATRGHHQRTVRRHSLGSGRPNKKELGGRSTEEEQEGLLKQREQTRLLLAARYRRDHQVGRARRANRLVQFCFRSTSRCFRSTWALRFFVVAIIFTALAVSGQKVGFSTTSFSTCLLQLFIQLSVVTLIFALVERHLTKHPDRWHVKKEWAHKFRLDLNIERDIQLRIGNNTREGFALRVPVHHCRVRAAAIGWMRRESRTFQFWILEPAAAFLKLAPIWYQDLRSDCRAYGLGDRARASINACPPGLGALPALTTAFLFTLPVWWWSIF